MPSLRAALILGAFLLFTLPLMPLQHLFVRMRCRYARTFPHWYHRQVCRLVGLRIKRSGSVVADKPVLLVANHVSWLDIPMLSAVAPLSFVAKREVGTWPLVGSLARLQRTVFIDRERRGSVAETAGAIMARLRQGDTIVLFAEGTSSNGNRVLPFKSSLFAAVKPTSVETTPRDARIVVQTLAIAYTHQQGLPFGRRERPYVAWYGAMEMGAHAWQLLKRGPIDVAVRIGPPVALDAFKDRKALARYSETQVRRDMAELLTPRHRRPAWVDNTG
jgi:1-acyl-sn-glycerol-3-phosphate acyltransferase